MEMNWFAMKAKQVKSGRNLKWFHCQKKRQTLLVQCEGKAILGMKAWHEVGAEHRNQIPRIALFKIITQH